jgi:hypothetical protein
MACQNYVESCIDHMHLTLEVSYWCESCVSVFLSPAPQENCVEHEGKCGGAGKTMLRTQNNNAIALD